MKGQKPTITSWRAFVDGKQIGSGYASEIQALKAAQEFIENEVDGNELPFIDVKPSFVPIRELV
jgi:hypothetical protein